ncbi:hypothetical protein A3I99_01480 [Candidatus Kaiserbacteria bacterium RIFCSPLOWO2_02_FULL_45_11b]|uniref:Uncharacterized protein n=1 Tax=Candidatus Kaiserbacteria bacterium RIFCSPLOWO2_12_FULL_45_26 TaxID=1798525 RepID=A0A1F6FFV2_9BACT|nr:MAG: hypothetical protein A2Z56_04125 [Candidatus Kaiserbacteria bacterium RIFCSPHIGHO2_12_45_16]OGG70501.1 MAG: hypothetical protein A2929_04725 [Candidatus Kaiserbacteria bacterium RIFCSPLOWO2_01_FULL_45_25]OGG80987.1 MAG: hypothetical protein A3I99_01480 [Candidatus Kaiserbacteria bacterium RIFCSPLOWO2_02_FULL_45_11b]OGG84728.1 MAG: hypothetical protein A3G90_01425 [Candidatus Kaiserbacteria bacterium RIFCSPLOWO2_12_FULL_45_26]
MSSRGLKSRKGSHILLRIPAALNDTLKGTYVNVVPLPSILLKREIQNVQNNVKNEQMAKGHIVNFVK